MFLDVWLKMMEDIRIGHLKINGLSFVFNKCGSQLVVTLSLSQIVLSIAIRIPLSTVIRSSSSGHVHCLVGLLLRWI